uniref:Dephospho-CoA kinase domain containing n=1 Tax=Meleagris gallopavo TaxID=9103 RepID=A0A803XQ26_MELGA
MFLVGLSGGIASGKSTVVAVLRELGCAVIDADVIAREVVQPRLKAYQQIVRCFGPEILQESGEIDREALGNIIFSHPEKRRLLNAITHPEIQKEMLKQVLKYFVIGVWSIHHCPSCLSLLPFAFFFYGLKYICRIALWIMSYLLKWPNIIPRSQPLWASMKAKWADSCAFQSPAFPPDKYNKCSCQTWSNQMPDKITSCFGGLRVDRRMS